MRRHTPLRGLLPLLLLIPLPLFYVAAYRVNPEGSFHWTAGFLALLVGYVATFADLRLGLALVLVGIGLSPDIDTAGVALRIEDFLIPAVAVAWATRMLLRREDLTPTTLKGPILAFIFVSAVAGLQGALIGREVAGASGMDRLFFLLKQCEYFLLFMLVINIVRTMREVKVYILLLLGVSAVIGLFGMQHAVTATDDRFTGVGGETANILGGYIFFNMCLAVGILLTARRIAVKVIAGAYLALMLLPFLATLSRSSWIAAVAGLTVLGFMRERRILFGLVLVIVLVPAISPEPVRERILSLATLLQGELPPSMEARLDGVIHHGRNFVDYPLLGLGPGSTPLGKLDNEYARVAVDTGIIGLLVFFWLLAAMLRLAYRCTDDDTADPLLRGFSVGYFAGLVGMMVHALAATSFMTIRTMEPLMFTTGLLVVIHNHFHREPDSRPGPLPISVKRRAGLAAGLQSRG